MTLDRKTGFPWTPGQGGGSARENYSERLLFRPTTRQCQFLGDLVAGLGLLMAGCVGGDDQLAPSGGSPAGLRAAVAPKPVAHHLPTVSLEEMTFPKVEAQAQRFVARASSGPVATVKVGELLGRSKARVAAIYNERILLDEPVSEHARTDLHKNRVIIELTDPAKTKVLKIRPLTEAEINSDGLPPGQTIRMEKTPPGPRKPETDEGN